MPIILLRMTSERHFFVALSFRGERREEGGGTNEKSGMLFYRERISRGGLTFWILYVEHFEGKFLLFRTF